MKRAYTMSSLPYSAASIGAEGKQRQRPEWETKGILIDQHLFPRLRKLANEAKSKWKKGGADTFWGARLLELAREHSAVSEQKTVEHTAGSHRDWSGRARSLVGRYRDFIRAMDYQLAHPEQFPPESQTKRKAHARAPRKTPIGKRAAELKAAHRLAHSIAARGGNFDEAERVYWQKHRSYPKGLVQKSMLRGWDEGRQAYLEKQQPGRAPRKAAPKNKAKRQPQARAKRKHNPAPRMTAAESKLWKQTPKDYRGIYQGQRVVLRIDPKTGATRMMPLCEAVKIRSRKAKAAPRSKRR